jgi:lipoate-protein ligase A
MEADHELFAALEDGRAGALPTLRLYGWRPWTVSLGQGQDPARALDLAALAARGYGWIKRPTGGRAVFHAEEITYAVAAPLTGPFADGVAASHRALALALARFYRGLGLAVELTRPAGRSALDPRRPEPCFLAPGLAELAVGGRKLAGSAQRRGRRAFLQHGSLPLSPRHLELADFLPLPAGQRERQRERLAARSVSLGELIDPLPARSVLMAALAAAFAAELDLEWAP